MIPQTVLGRAHACLTVLCRLTHITVVPKENLLLVALAGACMYHSLHTLSCIMGLTCLQW